MKKNFNPMRNFHVPTYLKPGDSVIAIATSGVVKDISALEAGLDIWRSRGYKVTLDDNWNAQKGYLAGDDKTRRNALIQAWNDPQYKAILCIRGGYGSARLFQLSVNSDQKCDPADASSAKERVLPEGLSVQNNSILLPSALCPLPSKKWIIGFSDITALLWSLAKEEIASLHGPILTTLAKEPLWSQERMFNYIEGKNIKPLQGKGWGGGTAEGILLPANLSVATHILGTPLQPNLQGTILALEDVTEYPYRIDRMLTQWRLMGILSGVKGIALGRFSRCEPYTGSVSFTVEEVLRDRLDDLGIPIVSELPFGHDGTNAVLPVGHYVKLDGDRGELSFS